ncbi:M23 family metallopeptidase [Luteimonas terrae]|uniref:Murein DD-endopeptidase MepM/ murein hydrolase activator NlpD n=1 Tax=Luteimonas terrae TaxID=1530191 RepID=A0ABU1XSN8_9GAMM|nr:M23 family metallopeptidase [Luteimonas terrae]MDR7191608.1 murein DD-endopeptidase MepM/ murein hydrolase activator NlpD [Luteimonas terrae]
MRRVRWHTTLALSAMWAAGAVQAQTPSTGHWTDAAAAQAAPAPVATATSKSAPRVELELRARFGGTEAIALNHLAGPVEVTLQAEGAPPIATPALPARATVPAGGRVVVANLRDEAAGTRLSLLAVPGLPVARVRHVEYLYPLRDAPLQIAQGYGGGFSHADAENRHAVDFAVTPGTPVLAARDGVVMQVEADATARLDPRATVDPADDRVRGNFIRILHDDGTMALYAHLQQAGVVVAPGARALRGTIIGFSGNTGLSTAPHLHFVVQANRGMRLESLPFRMLGPDGPLRFGQVQTDPAPAAP